MRDEALFNLEAKISTYGWTSYYIFGGPGPPWLYTIGLTEMVGHPELVVFGLDQISAYGMATRVIEEITSGREFTAGRDAGENLDATPVAFLEAADRFWVSPTTISWDGWTTTERSGGSRPGGPTSWCGATRTVGSPGTTISRSSWPACNPC